VKACESAGVADIFANVQVSGVAVATFRLVIVSCPSVLKRELTVGHGLMVKLMTTVNS